MKIIQEKCPWKVFTGVEPLSINQITSSTHQYEFLTEVLLFVSKMPLSEKSIDIIKSIPDKGLSKEQIIATIKTVRKDNMESTASEFDKLSTAVTTLTDIVKQMKDEYIKQRTLHAVKLKDCDNDKNTLKTRITELEQALTYSTTECNKQQLRITELEQNIPAPAPISQDVDKLQELIIQKNIKIRELKSELMQYIVADASQSTKT